MHGRIFILRVLLETHIVSLETTTCLTKIPYSHWRPKIFTGDLKFFLGTLLFLRVSDENLGVSVENLGVFDEKLGVAIANENIGVSDKNMGVSNIARRCPEKIVEFSDKKLRVSK